MKNSILILFFVMISCIVQAQKPDVSYGTPQELKVGEAMTPLSPLNSGGLPTPFNAVSTMYGNGSGGTNDGYGSSINFGNSSDLTFDPQGNMYVWDAYPGKIRKISPEGVCTTLTLSGSIPHGSITERPGIAADKFGSLFLTDPPSHMILKIDKNGFVSIFAGAEAGFNYPNRVAVDTFGNVYVTDLNNQKVYKITSTGTVTTLAGYGLGGYQDGTGTDVLFSDPLGITVDKSGNVYVSEVGCPRIRKITPAGVVTTVAGNGGSGRADGLGVNASFTYPSALVVDDIGNLFIADAGNNLIRKIDVLGNVTTIAGTGVRGYLDGEPPSAQFYTIGGIAIDAHGALYTAEYWHFRIRRIGPVNYVISPLLPIGLYFDCSTGVISGTPTRDTPQKTYTVKSLNNDGVCLSNVILSVNYPIAGLQNYEHEAIRMTTESNGNELRFSGLNTRVILSIYSMSGVLKLKQEVTNDIPVNVSNLVAGVYLVKVGGLVLKFVKK